MKFVSLLCVVVLFLAMMPTVSAAPAEPAYAISINGDADLLAQAELNHWPGDGSVANPIVIDGINFTAASSAFAFYAGNTTLHLWLSNCTFTEQSSSVVLYSTSNITVESCNFQNCYLGIGGVLSSSTRVFNSTFSCTLGAVVMVSCNGLDMTADKVYVRPGNDSRFLSGLSLQNCTDVNAYQCHFYNGSNTLNFCSNVTLSSGTFTDCEEGLTIAESDKVMVADTTWTDGQNGVVLGDNSTNVTLQWGMLNGCGIRFDATDPASYSTLVIDSVTVAGKPFFLLKNVNEHGASITTDAQQALLFRVSNATLINAVMTQSNGITLAFCTNVVIRNCTVTESIEYGVRLVQSQSCTVRDSVFISGRLGVEMWFGGVQNRVENCRFFNCAMAVAVHPLQDQPEVSSNSFEGCSIGIILGGLSAFASDNTLANCSGGAIVVSGGIQSVVVGNTITGGGYGIRMGDNNETMVQLNEISGAVVGIIIDSGNVRMYITGNLVVNCTSHAVRIYGEGNGTYIIGNRFLANNGAGTVYSSSHVQASDSYGYAIWNDTWGNYWSDWTSTSYTIGPYNISSASKDMTPYPMLVCGAPGNLTGKFNANNLTITWAVPTYPGFQEATSYAIYRGDSVGNMTKIATVSGSATSYTDRGLGSSTYYYQISAINPYGEGARSGVLSATQGSPGGVDMTLLIIGLLLVIVAIVIVILLLRNRR